jgi:hypothetical protein
MNCNGCAVVKSTFCFSSVTVTLFLFTVSVWIYQLPDLKDILILLAQQIESTPIIGPYSEGSAEDSRPLPVDIDWNMFVTCRFVR